MQEDLHAPKDKQAKAEPEFFQKLEHLAENAWNTENFTTYCFMAAIKDKVAINLFCVMS